jgi:glycerol-3-phosphate dehydrogenase (NAD(P)+)
MKPITILGAGSWGTALALYLSRRGQTVRLWSIDATEVSEMTSNRASRFLPGFHFPDCLHPTGNLEEAIEGVEDLLMVVPSVGFRSTLTLLKPIVSTQARIICASKGLDADTGHLSNQMVEDVLGKDRMFAVLSGPSFAREVAAGLPTAVVIASHDATFTQELMARFDSEIFRTFPSDDVTGVELGGVVKNVIAIATGMFDGMECGANARAALLTAGLAEITRLGVVLGAKAETFVGLSGLGDLILTATDDQSRNRRLGLALGKGRNIQEAMNEIGQVVEGKRNAEIVAALSAKHHINMPICNTVWDVLQGKLSAKEAMHQILLN